MPKDNEGPKPPPKPKKRITPAAPKAPTISDKARAGKLLSGHLRMIAQEETEFVAGPDGDKMATKAESLARLMFKIALGYEEVDVKTGKNKVIKPSAGMIALIFDRMEGRAPAANENLDKSRTVPNKVSDENKKILNDLAQGK